MSRIILIFTCFFYLGCYSQSKKKDSLYFFVDNNDSLVRKRVEVKGYSVCSEQKVRIKKNKTPLIQGKIWVEDNKYDYYEYGNPCLLFSYGKAKILIEKSDIRRFRISDREEFLKVDNLLFDYHLFFIEPYCDENRLLIREVLPVFFE